MIGRRDRRRPARRDHHRIDGARGVGRGHSVDPGVRDDRVARRRGGSEPHRAGPGEGDAVDLHGAATGDRPGGRIEARDDRVWKQCEVGVADAVVAVDGCRAACGATGRVPGRNRHGHAVGAAGEVLEGVRARAAAGCRLGGGVRQGQGHHDPGDADRPGGDGAADGGSLGDRRYVLDALELIRRPRRGGGDGEADISGRVAKRWVEDDPAGAATAVGEARVARQRGSGEHRPGGRAPGLDGPAVRLARRHRVVAGRVSAEEDGGGKARRSGLGDDHPPDFLGPGLDVSNLVGPAAAARLRDRDMHRRCRG